MPTRRPRTDPAHAAADAVLHDPAVLWDTLQRMIGGYVAVIDRAGIIRWCNRVDEADGITAADVVGHSLVRFTVPESSAALLDALQLVLADGQPRSLETTVQAPDGRRNYFTLRLAPLRVEGRIVAAMGCCESIRPLKESESALARERTVLRRLIDTLERERQLVSYEIHDGLAQYITGAIMHFEAHLYRLQEPDAAEAVEGMRLLRAAAEEARRLISGLRPPSLDELGIIDAIESLVADARLEIPAVEFVHHLPPERLPLPLETVVFRIVQESLTNARRHANAGRVEVRLERTPDGILVRVSDDGQGFDVEAVADTRFGLEGIRQRCRLFGASPRIESCPGRGTTIEVVLPVPDEPALAGP